MQYPEEVKITKFAIGNVTVECTGDDMTIIRTDGEHRVFDGCRTRVSGDPVYTVYETQEYHYFIGPDVPGGSVYEFKGMDYVGMATLPAEDLEPKLRELLQKFDGCMVTSQDDDVYLRFGTHEIYLGCHDVLSFVELFSRTLFHSSKVTHFLIKYDATRPVDAKRLNDVYDNTFIKLYDKLKDVTI